MVTMIAICVFVWLFAPIYIGVYLFLLSRLNVDFFAFELIKFLFEFVAALSLILVFSLQIREVREETQVEETQVA